MCQPIEICDYDYMKHMKEDNKLIHKNNLLKTELQQWDKMNTTVKTPKIFEAINILMIPKQAEITLDTYKNICFLLTGQKFISQVFSFIIIGCRVPSCTQVLECGHQMDLTLFNDLCRCYLQQWSLTTRLQREMHSPAIIQNCYADDMEPLWTTTQLFATHTQTGNFIW